MVQNQVLRASVVLLERSISGRKHGHVAVRQRGVGHLTGLQELVKLQQENRNAGIKGCSTGARSLCRPVPPINGGKRYVQNKNKKKKK